MLKVDPTSLSDDELLDRYQRAAFDYFLENVNPDNGLVADTSRPNSPASIAVVGFALSCYPIGVERGWMTREAAAKLTLAALRFFWTSTQGNGDDVTGHKGFYYHFLDMRTGRRVWRCELSMVDTALLMAGVLVAGAYFSGDGEDEREIRDLAEALYRRVDWRWAQGRTPTLRQGWKPKSGFLHYGWEGYNEATILYVLSMASPDSPSSDDSYVGWTATYQWENIYGYDVLYGGSAVHASVLACLDRFRRHPRRLHAREELATISKTAGARPTFIATMRGVTRMAMTATVRTVGAFRGRRARRLSRQYRASASPVFRLCRARRAFRAG